MKSKSPLITMCNNLLALILAFSNHCNIKRVTQRHKMFTHNLKVPWVSLTSIYQQVFGPELEAPGQNWPKCSDWLKSCKRGYMASLGFIGPPKILGPPLIPKLQVPPLIYLVGPLVILDPHINICAGPPNTCVALKQFNLLPPNTSVRNNNTRLN